MVTILLKKESLLYQYLLLAISTGMSWYILERHSEGLSGLFLALGKVDA